MEKVLLVNQWRTPDGTLLESKHRHDFVSHIDEDGNCYSIDGGTEYTRLIGDSGKMVSECIYSDDPIEKVREHLRRGTFDDGGNRIWVLLKNLSDSHLQNIIEHNIERGVMFTNPRAVQYLREAVYRTEHDISVPEHTYTAEDM